MSNCVCPNLEKGTKRPWRIVFFGSDAIFSLPPLQALVEGPDQVVLVVTSPPAPSGRGQKLSPSPVAELAHSLGLEVFLGKSVRSSAAIEHISSFQPDLLVVAAYGGFLPEKLLTLGACPPVNIHPSLLPRHRGAAPISWSLIRGDSEIGVSIIFLEKEMDAGPILRQKKFRVDCVDCAGTWTQRLARVGAEDLLEVVALLKEGIVEAEPQDHAQATINPLLTKNDGQVDWRRPAKELVGLVAGVDPWPGAMTEFKGKKLKIYGAEMVTVPAGGTPGQVLGVDEQERLLVATAAGVLAVAEVQPEGKKKMSATDFVRGYRPDFLGYYEK